MPNDQKTAVIIIIGDEILSGRVRDENSPFLLKELTEKGVIVTSCITIPDQASVIADTVRYYSTRATWVFTVGGIGPTPDDITMESIGLAFNLPLVTHPDLEVALKKLFGDRFRPEHLKMARVPEGAFLVSSEQTAISSIQFKNIIILPGVPEFA